MYTTLYMEVLHPPRGRLRAVEPLPKGNLNVTLEKMETDGPRCASVYMLGLCAP